MQTILEPGFIRRIQARACSSSFLSRFPYSAIVWIIFCHASSSWVSRLSAALFLILLFTGTTAYPQPVNEEACRSFFTFYCTTNGVKVDLVPATKQPNVSHPHSIYVSKLDTWTKTNIHKHINIIKKSSHRNPRQASQIPRGGAALQKGAHIAASHVPACERCGAGGFPGCGDALIRLDWPRLRRGRNQDFH